jgi:ATP-dependent Clp protease adapter protein ClpS
MNYSNEDYNKKIEIIKMELGIDNSTDNDIDTDSITSILNELGIRGADNNEMKLILWNDHVNDMVSVIVALYEVCKLSNERCMEVMLEAHEKGRSVIKTGSFDELNVMKTGLNDRNLEATIEE